MPSLRHLLVPALLAALSACSQAPELAPPPRLNLDPARSSVSGLSSGAYMAQQVHLAFSDRLIGAALFAGGPYGCAQGDLNTALGACMNPSAEQHFDLDALVAAVRERAQAGQLAPLSGLQDDRVFVWHGQKDALVAEATSEASAALYAQLDATVQLQRRFDQPFAHLLPTAETGGDCGVAAEQHIGACGFDGVGAALAHLYDVNEPAAEASGTLIEFDARVGIEDLPGDPVGFAYIPQACAAGERCGLHIAFHGCEQARENIGRAFAERAGYQRWADAAKLVVVYPQARASMLPLNPKACWDWWGYTGPDYDTRNGAQLRWIAALAAAFGAPLHE